MWIPLKVIFFLPFSCSSSALTKDKVPIDERSKINDKDTSKRISERNIARMEKQFEDNNLVLRSISFFTMMMITIISLHKTQNHITHNNEGYYKSQNNSCYISTYTLVLHKITNTILTQKNTHTFVCGFQYIYIYQLYLYFVNNFFKYKN